MVPMQEQASTGSAGSSYSTLRPHGGSLPQMRAAGCHRIGSNSQETQDESESIVLGIITIFTPPISEQVYSLGIL